MRWYFNHQIKRFFRSSDWEKQIIIQILLILGGIYMASMMAFMGFLGGMALVEEDPEQGLLSTLMPFILLFFLLEFVLRVLLQGERQTQLQPYLLLPVNKKKLLRQNLFLSFFSVFNLATFLFSTSVVLGAWSEWAEGCGIAWLALILGSMVCHLLVLSLRQVFVQKAWIKNILYGVAIAIALAFYFNWISLTDYIELMLSFQVDVTIYVILLLILTAGLFFLALRSLMNNSYSGAEKSDTGFISNTGQWFSRFGKPGILLGLELKLILRNKRTKQMFYYSFFVILLFCYLINSTSRTDADGTPSPFFLFGLMMTSSFMLTYGQYLGSWEAKHYDFLLSQNFTTKDYYKGKFYLLIATTILQTIIALLVNIGDSHWVLLLVCTYIYNIGVNSFLWMCFSVWNTEPIQLEKGMMMNRQGVTTAHYITGLPIFLAPISIYFLLMFIVNPEVAAIGLLVPGILGLLLQNYLIEKLSKRFNKHKHKLAAGYRQAT